MSEGRLAVLAAGGTGGHMFPAQALAEELLRRGWRVALATDARGEAYGKGFPAEVERRALKAGTPVAGRLRGKLAAPFALLRGTREAMRWFREARPAAVVGFGGYPAAPATAAAIRLRLPRMLHEQNAVLGRANRLFVKRVALLACGIAKPANCPPGVRVEVTGNPIRDAARALAGTPYEPPGGDGPVRLLAFGGSQGASALSEAVPAALAALPPALRARFRLTQQAREAEAEVVRAACAEAGIGAEVAPFFADMPQRIADAHLVVARAGASTCAELTAIGRPSILVPLPTAMADHQTANARSLEAGGAALLAPQSHLNAESLAANLSDLLAAPERLSGMAEAARALGRPQAAEMLADLVEALGA